MTGNDGNLTGIDGKCWGGGTFFMRIVVIQLVIRNGDMLRMQKINTFQKHQIFKMAPLTRALFPAKDQIDRISIVTCSKGDELLLELYPSPLRESVPVPTPPPLPLLLLFRIPSTLLGGESNDDCSLFEGVRRFVFF